MFHEVAGAVDEHLLDVARMAEEVDAAQAEADGDEVAILLLAAAEEVETVAAKVGQVAAEQPTAWAGRNGATIDALLTDCRTDGPEGFLPEANAVGQFTPPEATGKNLRKGVIFLDGAA